MRALAPSLESVWIRGWLNRLFLVLILTGVMGCQREEKDRSQPEPVEQSQVNLAQRAQASESPKRDASGEQANGKSSSPIKVEKPSQIEKEGLYEFDTSKALAFSTGMSKVQTQGLLQAAVDAEAIQLTLNQMQSKRLRGQQVEVLTQELTPVGESEVLSLRLTHFGDWLVSVMVLYKEPDSQRALAWAKAYGQGVHADGWMGWWLREQEQIVQGSPDGSVFEVFDLAFAQQVVPEIHSIMLDSWRKRYRVPPPWGEELLAP